MHGKAVPAAGACAPEVSTLTQLERWQRLTRSALDAQAKGHPGAALLGYRSALTAAESLFDDPLWTEAADNVLAAFVVSHHNLADLLDELDQPAEGVRHLCDPHRHLLALDTPAQDPAVRRAAWRHLGETRRQLLLWRHQHRERADVGGAIDAALHAHPPGAVPH